MPSYKLSKCPHCGATNRINRFTLNSGIVSILIQVYKVVRDKRLNVANRQELNQSHSQYTNMSHARYFGLIAKYKENGEVVKGSYVVTHWGFQFLKNKLAIPKYAWVFRNKLQEREGDLLLIERVFRKNQPVDWQTEYEWEPALSFQVASELEFPDGGES